MKKILLSLLLMPILGIAQTTIKDSMVMGPNYANQVYYNMATGTLSKTPMNNWHIALVPNKYDAGIWANETQGVSVYVDTFTSNFGKVDTTGMTKKWPQLYNPDTSWSVGAFNTYGASGFDYGWGSYDGTSHNITGTRVYVLKIKYGSGNTMYRKIKFEVKQGLTSGKLNAGDILFHYASLDSTLDKRDTMRYATWKNKLLVYYDLVGDSFVNREPDMDNWDLTMTKYITNIGIEYPVTGVLQNYYSNMFGSSANNVKIAKAAKIDTTTVKYTSYTSAFSSHISAMGYNWVNYDLKLSKYVLVDSLVYFVKTGNSDIYKLRVTYFVGSADGKMLFDKTKVLSSTTSDISYNKGFECHVVGNPVVVNSIQLLTDNIQPIQNATINIVDITGKIVKTYELGNIDASLHAWNININNICNGVYLIQFTNNQNVQAVTRVVIAR